MIFFGYALSGPLELLFGWTKLVDDDDIFEQDEQGSIDT
jgi:CDP-diacylglycerol---serine O-phosphatidyltransferase